MTIHLPLKTGKEAVERDALPNDDPASYRFTIKPLKDTKIQKGIVQPANGHQGGGVEVILINGRHDEGYGDAAADEVAR